jgi:hypothetical protein
MNTNSERNGTDPLHGSLLRIGERREIAIYLRDGTAWVTDFKHGHGVVSTAGAWFALNQDRWALRRATLDAITPLPADIVQRIENLHRRMAQPSVGPALPRALVTLVGEFRGRLARLYHALLGPRPAHPLDPAT